MRKHPFPYRTVSAVLCVVLLLSCVFCGAHTSCCADEDCVFCLHLRALRDLMSAIGVAMVVYGIVCICAAAVRRARAFLPVRLGSLFSRKVQWND